MSVLRKITNVLRYGRWTACRHRLWGLYTDRHHRDLVQWICRSCGARR